MELVPAETRAKKIRYVAETFTDVVVQRVDCVAPTRRLYKSRERRFDWLIYHRRTFLSATILRLLLAVGAMLASGWAHAHAIVVRTSPAQDGVAAGNIAKVEVWYDAGIRDAFVALAVVSASGERVDKRDAAIDGSDPSHVSVGVNQLTPGKYTVRYRALSADGHIVSGAWDFEVKP